MVSIHSEHPFLPSVGDRDSLRRLRGRFPAAVSLWTAADDHERQGLTVSSMMIGDGQPGQLLGLIDEDSDLWPLLDRTKVVAVSLLRWPHRMLADGFAGTGPAPGGAFRMGHWTETRWGPVLSDAAAWLGARLLPGRPDHAGWGLLVRASIEKIEIAGESDEPPLTSWRGRYRELTW